MGRTACSNSFRLDQWGSVLIDFSEKASSTEFSLLMFIVNGKMVNDNVTIYTAYIDDFYYEVPQVMMILKVMEVFLLGQRMVSNEIVDNPDTRNQIIK